MQVIGYNYPTDDAQEMTHPKTGKGIGWRFTLRSFASLPVLESAARGLARSGFDDVRYQVAIKDDQNPTKNKMGRASSKRGPGRPAKDPAVKRYKTN